jgi:hypothetical protein
MVSLNPLYFALFFLVLWVLMNLIISRLTGWARMAAHYPYVGGFTGKIWRFQTVTTRRGMGYKGNVSVGADSRGLYLSMFALFRFGHRPLFVPWHDITITEKQIFKSKALELRFRKTEDLPVRIFAKLGDHLAQAAGSNWPSIDYDGKTVTDNK